MPNLSFAVAATQTTRVHIITSNGFQLIGTGQSTLGCAIVAFGKFLFVRNDDTALETSVTSSFRGVGITVTARLIERVHNICCCYLRPNLFSKFAFRLPRVRLSNDAQKKRVVNPSNIGTYTLVDT